MDKRDEVAPGSPRVVHTGGQYYVVTRSPNDASDARASVRFMAGTDLSSRDVDGFRRPFHIPGVGLHDELALFVNSGFTPAEALRTATSNVASTPEDCRSSARWKRGSAPTSCSSMPTRLRTSGIRGRFTRSFSGAGSFQKRTGRHGRSCRGSGHPDCPRPLPPAPRKAASTISCDTTRRSTGDESLAGLGDRFAVGPKVWPVDGQRQTVDRLGI